ncbi:MAG TPA: carboxypeptidase-like regulatory domain-containing protein, partial [Verrucomicrobiae bacterium]|nr:carboxypeptidase-like regulatory domain-containing protein [Verrucomicrobiae bacterium]
MLFAMCCALFASELMGQTTAAPQAAPAPTQQMARGNGTVTGTVADDTGGVIPRATVTLTDSQGAVRTVSTQGDGSYTFDHVAPGTYSVNAEFTGMVQSGAILVQVTGRQPVTSKIV